jgi:hypothetical protein
VLTATAPPAPPAAAPAIPVQVWLRGVFPADTADRARRAISALLAQEAVPVRGVRVRLGVYPDPAVHFPVVAQGTLQELRTGTSLRAQAHAATAREAIDLLEARLRHQLHWTDHRSEPQEWRRHMPPNPWVVCYPRPPHARQVVRCKPGHLALLGVDEAVLVLERRDYDFHLFIEVGSGQDSVVYRAGPTGYRLAQLVPAPEAVAPHQLELTWYDRPAPELRTAGAAEWLGLSEVSFLFFRDLDRGRGSVLYRRYDGNYGLMHARRGVAGRAGGGQQR